MYSIASTYFACRDVLRRIHMVFVDVIDRVPQQCPGLRSRCTTAAIEKGGLPVPSSAPFTPTRRGRDGFQSRQRERVLEFVCTPAPAPRLRSPPPWIAGRPPVSWCWVGTNVHTTCKTRGSPKFLLVKETSGGREMALTRHSHIHDAHIEKALRDTYPRFRILSISPSRRARLRGHVRRAAHKHPPTQPRHPQERTRRASTTRSHGRPGRVAQEARAARGPRRQRRGPVAAAAGPQGRREAREPRSRRLRHGDQAPGRRRRRRRPGPQAAVLGARRGAPPCLRPLRGSPPANAPVAARALLPVTQPRRQLRLRRLVGHHDDDDDGGGPRGARRGRRGRLVGRDGGGGGGARAAPDEGAGKRGSSTPVYLHSGQSHSS